MIRPSASRYLGTDDAFHIESGGADSILFAHFLSQLRRPPNERPSGMGMIISSREGTGRWAYGRGEWSFVKLYGNDCSHSPMWRISQRFSVLPLPGHWRHRTETRNRCSAGRHLREDDVFHWIYPINGVSSQPISISDRQWRLYRPRFLRPGGNTPAKRLRIFSEVPYAPFKAFMFLAQLFVLFQSKGNNRFFHCTSTFIMWQSYQNKTARLIEWGITFQLFSDTFNSKQLIQAIPGNLKNPSSVPPFQEERTKIQTTAFQTVFVVAPIKDMQPATGAVGKNMTALLWHAGTCVSDDLATKTVNTFMEITTLGIKVIRPKRTAAEKAKT